MKKYYSNFEVIKDQKSEKYYGAIKDFYDKQDERTIISEGTTKEQAYENAIKSFIKTINISLDCYEKIVELIEDHSNMKEKYFLETHYVKDADYPEEEGYSALLWNPEEKKWLRWWR